jgi:hypothetical protein
MIIFSLPYLFDFICGIYAMMMMSNMAKFNKNMSVRRSNEEAARQLFSDEVNLKYNRVYYFSGI